MARQALDEFYARVDTDALLSTPPVHVYDCGVECAEDGPWFGQPGEDAPTTFEEFLRLHLRQRSLARADVDEFVTRFKRRLEDDVRQQGAQRDVCDAETLEGILRQTLLACAVDWRLQNRFG